MTYLDYFPYPMDERAAVAYAVATGLVAIALAIVILVAEPRSPAARGLALTFASLGVLHIVITPFGYLDPLGTAIPKWTAALESGAVFGVVLMVLYVARTAQLPTTARIRVQVLAWATAAVGLSMLPMGLMFPAVRLHEFYFCIERTGCTTPGFWLYGGAFTAVGTIGIASAVILLSQRIDRAESIRVGAVLIATPLLTVSALMPRGYFMLANLAGLLIFLLAMIRYYVIQGERGAFMSRFLSPEFAKVVRTKGVEQAVQPQNLEITVVSCDLRGFTKLSQLLASDQVIRLLNEYYDAIGAAVAEFGATIKDYAGDGVLILVGAPLSVNDHAQKGIALARRLQEFGRNLICHWAGPEMTLGMGVGVASGRVTVGAVGSSSRMEYTAVGPAVNLASRLCSQAADGEILVDARTAELAGNSGLETRGRVPLKGFGEVQHFACMNP